MPKFIKLNIYFLYLYFILFIRKIFGIKAYGLGWVASKINHKFSFAFNGAHFEFVPTAARSYGFLPLGFPNEPETHLFLERILDGKSDVLFIDVGASVGEFVIPMSHDSRISKILAFEPNSLSREALMESAKYSPAGKIEIIGMGVSSKKGFANFDTSENAPMTSRICSKDSISQGIQIEICTLDGVVKLNLGQPVLILIDIEGGELNALVGGIELIRKSLPLLIFEYNNVTRQVFLLSEAIELLGPSYAFFRLRSNDGVLDTNFSLTWNIVALPLEGPWAEIRGVKGLFDN